MMSMATLKVQEAGVQVPPAYALQIRHSKAKMLCSIDSSGRESDWACTRKLLLCKFHKPSIEAVCVQAHDWLSNDNGSVVAHTENSLFLKSRVTWPPPTWLGMRPN